MKWGRITLVIVGALIVTALGIDATDTLRGSKNTLLAQLITTNDANECPSGMLHTSISETFDCVDIYEASAGEMCAHTDPKSLSETRDNIGVRECVAVSEAGQIPWRFVTREDAQALCLRAGKRLPSNREWHLIAAGTLDSPDTCNTHSTSVDEAGTNDQCISSIGIHDAIGNVWEWTSDDVIDGEYMGRKLPVSGYVVQIDNGGVATQTGEDPSTIYYDDYFWSNSEGTYAIMRGGFFASKSDAGVYSAHAATPSSLSGNAVGFRCVSSF